MFDLIRAFDSVDLNKRISSEIFEDLILVIDTCDEGYLVKVVNKKGYHLSKIIRGFGDKKELNNFLERKLGHIINEENEIIMVPGMLPPPFNDYILDLWEEK